MAKCPTEEVQNDLQLRVEAKQAEIRSKIEETIILPSEPAIMKFLRKLGDYTPFTREITSEEWDSMYGPEEARQNKANAIAVILQDNEHLADYMIEYIKNDIVRPSIQMQKTAFKTDEITGKKVPVLENFPLAKLNLYYNELSQWAKAEGKDWNNARFKMYHLSIGLPKNLQMKENSGAYARIYRATERHADAMASRIAKHWQPVDDLYRGIGELWKQIDPAYQQAWKKNFGTEIDAKEWLHSVFNRMAHGQIVQVDQATYEASVGERGGKIFKDGPGMYIYTQWAPTGNQFKATGDAVYRWRTPVKFEGYNPEVHGTVEDMKLFDHLGRGRRDLLDFIQKSIPLNDTMIQGFTERLDKFREINDQVYNGVNKLQVEEFAKLMETVKKFFPRLSLKDVKSLFIDENTDVLNKLDDETRKAYMKEYNFLEGNFTQYALSEPFLREGVAFQYKESHFPAIYHTGEYPIMLKEAIVSTTANIESLKGAMEAAETPADKLAFRKEIAGLEKSLFNMERTKATLLDMPFDMESDTKMVTRRDAKYGKHISNAFDMLKMRTDSNVYYDYLKHFAATTERNILTTELLESFLMTDSEAVKQANIALFKRTIGFPDARGNIFGIEFNNEDLPEWSRTLFRSARDYWMLKISGPTTAFINQFGHLQKVIEVGLGETVSAWDDMYEYRKSSEIKPKYEKFVLDSGVTQFEDFFTHSLVQDLEQVEMKRDDAIQISGDIIKYYNNRNKGMNKGTAQKILNDSLMERFGRAIDAGAILSSAEAKALSKREKNRRLKSMTGKIVNYSISKEYTMRRALRDAPNSIKNLPKQITFGVFETYAKWIKKQLPSLVMSTTEASLRETSLILGVKGAQSKELIPDMPFYDLPEGSQEREDAIKYGRMMTRTVMDFGMSKNDVGEMHATVIGNLVGQFAVWKQQKQAADVNLYKKAWKAVKDNQSTPAAIKELVGQLARFHKYPQSDLRTTNPDVANLRAFLATQGVMTLAFDLFFGYTALFNNPWIRTIGYKVGFSKMGGATSDVQSWMNLVFILAIRAATDNWWEDEEELEKQIGYYARRTPLGLGFGLGVDLASMLVFYHNENIRAKKFQALGGMIIPPQIPAPLLQGPAKALAEELD